MFSGGQRRGGGRSQNVQSAGTRMRRQTTGDVSSKTIPN
jgi:hypothetical protein